MSTNSKKISQTELRKFMVAHKRKASELVKKIESPLARYSESGALTCIVCNSGVKSESVWRIHINSKQHKDNIVRKNHPPLPEISLNQDLIQKKQTLPPLPSHPTLAKKPKKSILKNATPLPPKFFDNISSGDDVGESETPEKKVKVEDKTGVERLEDGNGGEEENGVEPMETEPSRETELPEGFFDDPVLDAKARKVEYKDPVEEEWERFQKEIKEETDLSAKLIHEDTEDATVQRQIDQIDEQISKLSRVVQLELKKDEVKAKVLTKTEVKKEELSNDESDDSDIEVEFDWRAKSYLS